MTCKICHRPTPTHTKKGKLMSRQDQAKMKLCGRTQCRSIAVIMHKLKTSNNPVNVFLRMT